MAADVNRVRDECIEKCMRVMNLLEEDRYNLSRNLQGDIYDVYAELIKNELNEWNQIFMKIRQL